MTQAFLIVLRLLLVGLIGYWAYRLWIGTTSFTSRAVGLLCTAVLLWQVASTFW